MTGNIDISRLCNGWPQLENKIRQAAQKTLRYIPADSAQEISIVLADDEFIQKLNKTWRGRNKPTNVLSFPQNNPQMLGDVVLAYQTILKESQKQKKTFENHVLHLIVHGILHLAGYDHEEEEQARKMETLEIKILAALGIENPYK